MVQASGVADSSPARLASAARVSSGPASKPGSLGLELPSRMGSGRTRAVAMVSNTASPDNPLESASVFAKRVLELGKEGILELREDVQGAKSDVLVLLLATACVIPVFKMLDMSPILGFLLSGCVL